MKWDEYVKEALPPLEGSEQGSPPRERSFEEVPPASSRPPSSRASSSSTTSPPRPSPSTRSAAPSPSPWSAPVRRSWNTYDQISEISEDNKKCFGCWAVFEEDWLVEERLEDALLLFHVLVKVLQELVDLTCGFNIKLCGFEIMTNWNVSALNRSWEANHEWYNNCNTSLTLQPLPIKGAACLVKRGVDRLHQVNDRQLRAIKFHQQCCQHSASASWHSWWQSSPTRSPHGSCKRTGCTPACCASSLAASAMSVFTKPINLVSLGAALSVPCSNTIWQPKPPRLQ